MNNEQCQNKNEWAELAQGLSPPQQTYASEDYTPVQGYSPQGYAPIQGHDEAQAPNGYPDYQDSSPSSDGTYQTRDVNAYTVDDDNDDIPEEEVRKFVSIRRKRKSKGQAILKKEQPQSKRAKRREKIANEHGEVSAKDGPKGLVESRQGCLTWFDPEDQRWRKAAYHESFREEFIREDSSVGTYVVAPDCGKGANDITSACAAFNQLEWNLKDRDSWDNVVDADGNKVLYRKLSFPDPFSRF